MKLVIPISLIILFINSSCRKDLVEVLKKDNKIKFEIKYEGKPPQSYKTYFFNVGYTDNRNSIKYINSSLVVSPGLPNNEIYSCTLYKGDQYLFCVTPPDILFPNFTMNMYVNNQLYQTQTINNPDSSQFPYVITGVLETEYK